MKDTETDRANSTIDTPTHPAADIFPMMSEAEFQLLKADISQNGQSEPCVFFEGQLIDGRNRWRACNELGITPEQVSIQGDPWSYVISRNVCRRHLSQSQLACVAVEILPNFEAEAKERMSKGGKGVAELPPLEVGKARDKAAQVFGVSPRYVSDAKRLKEHGGGFWFQQVKSGEMSLSKALDLMKRLANHEHKIGCCLIRLMQQHDQLKRSCAQLGEDFKQVAEELLYFGPYEPWIEEYQRRIEAGESIDIMKQLMCHDTFEDWTEQTERTQTSPAVAGILANLEGNGWLSCWDFDDETLLPIKVMVKDNGDGTETNAYSPNSDERTHWNPVLGGDGHKRT